MEDAKKGNYALGVKLVRGAYQPYEVEAHAKRHLRSNLSTTKYLSISPEEDPPVFTEKEHTDAAYTKCVRLLIDGIHDDIQSSSAPPSKWNLTTSKSTLPKLGLLFGTHNWHSCDTILNELVSKGLATLNSDGSVEIGSNVAERVTIAQLYGMSDALTNSLVERTKSPVPVVMK